MTAPTQTRADHIRTAAASLGAYADPEAIDGAIDALAEAVVDSCLATDGPAMEAASAAVLVAAGDLEGRGADGERADEVDWAEQRGRLYGFADVLRWQLRARNDIESAVRIEPRSHAHKMLSLIALSTGEPAERLNGSRLAKRLGVDKTQVSRTSRDLIERGLVVTTSLGRKTFWDITPKGRYALSRLGTLDPDEPAAPTDAPVALSLDGAEHARAVELAADLTAEYDELTAYIVSPRALGERKHKPIMLLDAPHGKRSRLREMRKRIVAQLRSSELEVVPSNGGRTFTVGSPPRAASRVKTGAAH